MTLSVDKDVLRGLMFVFRKRIIISRALFYFIRGATLVFLRISVIEDVTRVLMFY